MYMASMATHMSMQDNTNRIAEATSNLGAEYGVGVGCRGMVVAAPLGDTPGLHGFGGNGGAGGHLPRRGMSGRVEKTGMVDDAGTSRRRGPAGGRNGAGASSSEEE